jgi:hypothetical protein
MLLPDYWMPCPADVPDQAARSAFEALLHEALGAPGGPEIAYTLPFPKWQFLCHVAEQHDIALHGSGNPDISLFEPRQSNDLNDFGNQKAVYAAADGIWSMFFAIADRDRFKMSVTNACIRVKDETGSVAGPFYFFSVSDFALPSGPWRTGTVYLLPRQTFSLQPPFVVGPAEVLVAQLASFVPVQPLARLTVEPADFPFLEQVRGHDDTRFAEYGAALQSGAPLPDD